MKVNFIWLGTTLRMEAREERLELEPTPSGVDAVFPDRRVALDLDGKPGRLIQEWLETLDRKIRSRQPKAPVIEEE